MLKQQIKKLQEQKISLKNSLRINKKIIKTNSKTVTNYIKTVQGSRSQTKQLNINLKSLTLKHLRSFMKAKQFNHTQTQIIEKYQKMSASFKAMNLLFNQNSPQFLDEKEQMYQNQSKKDCKRNSKIKAKCYSFYRSSKFISQIIKSQKMFLINKIAMIKYLKSIEEGVYLKEYTSENQKKGQEKQTKKNEQQHTSIKFEQTQVSANKSNNLINIDQMKKKKFIKKRQWKCKPFQFILNKNKEISKIQKV